MKKKEDLLKGSDIRHRACPSAIAYRIYAPITMTYDPLVISHSGGLIGPSAAWRSPHKWSESVSLPSTTTDHRRHAHHISPRNPQGLSAPKMV